MLLFHFLPTPGGEGNRPEGGRKERESFNASRILEVGELLAVTFVLLFIA